MTGFPTPRTASMLLLALAAPLAAQAQIGVSVTIAPPALPLYAQPPIPAEGYLWTPGYWAWDAASGDYIWVPGTWVLPPGPGLLWTPGYWGFVDGGYRWHRGYWGPRVGYYGGINYGYGYIGHGYAGGRWDRGRFRYNTEVNNIPHGRVHDVYRAPVPQRPAHQDSFNGGNSHWHTSPTAGERRFEGGRHPDWTPDQNEHEHRAFGTPGQHLGSNHGMPPTAATPRPGGFGDPQAERGRPAPAMRVQPVRPSPAMRPVGPAGPGGPALGGRPPGGEPHGVPGGGGRPGANPGGAVGPNPGGNPGGHPGGNPGGGHPGGGHPGGQP